MCGGASFKRRRLRGRAAPSGGSWRLRRAGLAGRRRCPLGGRGPVRPGAEGGGAAGGRVAWARGRGALTCPRPESGAPSCAGRVPCPPRLRSAGHPGRTGRRRPFPKDSGTRSSSVLERGPRRISQLTLWLLFVDIEQCSPWEAVRPRLRKEGVSQSRVPRLSRHRLLSCCRCIQQSALLGVSGSVHAPNSRRAPFVPVEAVGGRRDRGAGLRDPSAWNALSRLRWTSPEAVVLRSSASLSSTPGSGVFVP